MRTEQRVLLGVTGSIAAVKTPEIVRLLKDKSIEVSCVMTISATQFVSPLALSVFCGELVYSNAFGPDAHRMPHLRLAREADVMLIAPITATVLSRCARGSAEDMVSLCYLTTTAPVIMAPAMHSTMWEHPATQQNAKILKDRGVTFLGPHQGPLADSLQGEGRMTEPEEIVRAVEKLLSKVKKED